jgi:alpha-L-rhamnosidase
MRAEHLDNPLGIDVARPRLSWWLPADATAQSA